MSTSHAQLCASALSVFLLASVASAAELGAGVINPADHAPAGVMADHTHEAGEFMVGYRYMFDYSGETMLDGDREVGDPQLALAGFSAPGERMTMHMHMLDIMYAPADWVTLMVMPQYMTMNMRMREVEGGAGHGGHGGHSGAHEHGVSGFGDTGVAALFRLLHATGQHIHATVGFSMPTGSVSERGNDGIYTHYMMQLGSGTWDFLPGLTYSGHSGAWGWGAQLAATIKLDEENDSGFRFGDRYQATIWGSRTLADWLSASLRLAYAAQGNISGHYDGPHNHSSPPDLQANYGGTFLDLGIGLNALVPLGNLSGNRLGVEWTLPVYQDVNGFQQRRSGSLFVVWSQSL